MSIWKPAQINSEVLILMAIKHESQGLFEKAGFQVHYTGIGKINATHKATELALLKKPKYFVNLGTAGSHKFKMHELIECSGFVDRDVDMSLAGFQRGVFPGQKAALASASKITDFPSGICGSGDHLEIGVPKMECDLMDMEAYAIASVAEKYKIQYISIKYISDSSDENLKKDWQANLKTAAESLLKGFLKSISNIQE